MAKVIPDGFLAIRDAAAILVTAKHGGLPDRAIVQALREQGAYVADGEAVDEAISEIWTAVTDGRLEAFVVSAKDSTPRELPDQIVMQIPGLRSPRGRDFRFLRNRNPHMRQFTEWFGREFDVVDLEAVFRQDQVQKMARAVLRRRRAPTGKKPGRPSKMSEVKVLIRGVLDHGKWSPLQSIKSLTAEVNRRGNSLHVSEDSVGRALKELHDETCDRRLARLQRHQPTVAAS